MIIAVATENGAVAAHFGHCPEYTLVKAEGGAILEQKVIPIRDTSPVFCPVTWPGRESAASSPGHGQPCPESLPRKILKPLSASAGR